jgi:DNA-binding transcriptional ArsR family regulator
VDTYDTSLGAAASAERTANAAPGPGPVAALAALGALGDPTRRAIFERLAERPSAVGDIAVALPVSRPAVSQHLKVLKEAGLVRDVREGTRRVYSLDPVGIGGLRDYLDRFWNTALHSFKARVELVQHEAQQQSQQEDIP